MAASKSRGKRMGTVRGGAFPAGAHLAFCFFLLLAAASGARAQEKRPAGPVVRSVAFQVASPYPISHEELARLVAVRPGAALTAEAVRESIRGLFAKALFSSVTVFSRTEGDAADLFFFLRPLPVILDVEVAGKAQPVGGASAVVAASRVRRGTPMAGRDYSEYERAVRDFLRKRGFTSASVSVSSSCSLDTGAGRVKIDVRPGTPAVIRSIEAKGALFFSASEIQALLGQAVGDRFDYRRWEEGVRKLRTAYKRAGFLAVRIPEPQTECEAGDDVCLALSVEERTRYRVAWEGNRAFSEAELEEAGGLYGPDEATEAGLLHDVPEKIAAFYREKGYFRAEVRAETGEPGPDGRRPFKILVREGEKGHVEKIRFEGNAGIPAKTLRGQMLTRTRGPFHLFTGSGRFSEEDWNSDLLAIVGLYQREGYVRARIASVDNTWDARGGITQVIRIEEGPRYRLKEITFRGNDHFLKSELLALMVNREGRFVDYVGLERDQEAIATHYRDAGYLDARVEGSLAFDEKDRSVAARFDIAEGPRYRLGKVVVRGNVLTDAAVVLREMRIPPGRAIGEKEILSFQQAVFGTGLFRNVRVQRVKDPALGLLDLVAEVEEALFFEVAFGAGYGTDTGARGFVETRHRNLDGKGRALTAHASVSEKERKIVGDLREPWIFGPRWKWEGGLTASHQVADRPSFSIRKTSLVTSLNRTVFDRSTLSLQYELSRDRVFDVAPGAVIAPEDRGGANIAALRGLFVLDFRDDPFNPRWGSLQAGTLEFASYALGSEVAYVRASGQSAWYFPVFRRNTFVLSGRGGFARPLRATVEVPIQKRFFLGGRTTVRGFKEESLGPIGPDGAPSGGDYMVNGNAELRVPLLYGFATALFLDAGSVWLRQGPQARLDLRKSAGVGLRYVTPLGPISFDYAWKLDRRSGESGSEWHFTIGAVF